MEEMSGGHVILIERDNTGDCSIMSRDAPGGPKIDIGCHGYQDYLITQGQEG